MSPFRRRRATRPNPWQDPDDPAPRAEPAPRQRSAGLAAVGTMSSGVIGMARAIMGAAVLIALLIGLAIVLRDVSANAHNTIVSGIHDGANFFAGSFTGLVTFHGHPKRAITVDWGIALLAYLAAGALVAAFVGRFGRHGLAWERRHRAGAVT
jgi:hypothetical protein